MVVSVIIALVGGGDNCQCRTTVTDRHLRCTIRFSIYQSCTVPGMLVIA